MKDSSIDVEQICSNWSNNFFICKWKERYVLVFDKETKDEKELSVEQAEQIIKKLKLIPIKNGGLKDAFNYFSKHKVHSLLKEFEEQKREKESEVVELDTVIYELERSLRKIEIDAEVKKGFDSWKLAKKELRDMDDIGDFYKLSLGMFDADHWKKCLDGSLSYEDEYLCIMQYELLNSVNAEMGRSHGKGTFGYRFKDATKEEHDKMQEITFSNFIKYLNKIKVDSTEEFEGISQDREGGYHFEELEDK